MANFIDLDVPFVSQRDIGIHTGTKSHSEQNGCWYASTCMVSYFWEIGPRLGVPEQYTSQPDHHDPAGMGARYDQLVDNEGFQKYPVPTSNTWTIEELFNVVKDKGPCYVRRGFRDKKGNLTGGHAIVLKGANKDTKQVAMLDPWEKYTKPVKVFGKTLIKSKHRGREVYSLDEFNDFFKFDSRRQYSLMYKNPPNGVTAASHIEGKKLDSWK